MANNQEETITFGEDLISWEVPEYVKHERSSLWYIIAGVIGFALLILSVFTANYLFSFIIVLVALIVIITAKEDPEKVVVSITDEGIIVGRKFYDFDEFKTFSVIYKPSQNVKNLYFEFHNFTKQRLSILLEDMNPLPIRELLLQFMQEDLDRTDIPLSEMLARLFRL